MSNLASSGKTILIVKKKLFPVLLILKLLQVYATENGRHRINEPLYFLLVIFLAVLALSVSPETRVRH